MTCGCQEETNYLKQSWTCEIFFAGSCYTLRLSRRNKLFETKLDLCDSRFLLYWIFQEAKHVILRLGESDASQDLRLFAAVRFLCS